MLLISDSLQSQALYIYTLAAGRGVRDYLDTGRDDQHNGVAVTVKSNKLNRDLRPTNLFYMIIGSFVGWVLNVNSILIMAIYKSV